MLSLRLKSGEYFTIGKDITVQAFHQKGGAIEVAVQAPREIPVLRGELLERTDERPKGLREKNYKRRSEIRHSIERRERLQEKHGSDT